MDEDTPRERPTSDDRAFLKHESKKTKADYYHHWKDIPHDGIVDEYKQLLTAKPNTEVKTKIDILNKIFEERGYKR